MTSAYAPSCVTLCDDTDCSLPGSSVWNFPGKNIGAGSHFPQAIYRHLVYLTYIESCCSVTQLCLTLCDPMDCSTPGFSVLHNYMELAQTHVHWVGDDIQPSHPLSPSPPTFNLSQHLGFFK